MGYGILLVKKRSSGFLLTKTYAILMFTISTSMLCKLCHSFQSVNFRTQLLLCMLCTFCISALNPPQLVLHGWPAFLASSSTLWLIAQTATFALLCHNARASCGAATYSVTKLGVKSVYRDNPYIYWDYKQVLCH